MIEDMNVGTVGQLMSIDPLTIDDDAPVDEAAKVMDTFAVTGLPVVDATGQLVGVISQTDLVRAASTAQMWNRWPRLQVRHLMTSPAMSVQTDCGLQEAAQLMEHKRIHRLVVVDHDGITPIGVLSLADFVHLIAGDERD